MTRSKRLYQLLKTIKAAEEKKFSEIWMEEFEISRTTDIYEILYHTQKEIDSFALELQTVKMDKSPPFQKIIQTLNSVINFPSINASIANQAFIKDEQINIVFNTFEIYEHMIEAEHLLNVIEEDIPEDEFEVFKELLDSMIEELKLSEIEESDKELFLSIFNDIRKAFSLYRINGLESFIEAIRNNFCKIQMIDDSKMMMKD